MNISKKIILSLSLLTVVNLVIGEDDSRQLVELPTMMQTRMLSNMRDHLSSINEIQNHLANDEMDKAALVAENRLGMSSLGSHHAKHMSQFMPKGMAAAGTAMHKAASRFALKAEEGDLLIAYKALAEVTATCVACHTGFRIR